MIHQIKLQRQFFEKKIEGRKAWELRLDDRDYRIGDYLGENEVDEAGDYTGRFVIEKIVDILYPGEAPDGALGKGYVILSTVPCDIVSAEELMRDIGAMAKAYGGVGEEAVRSNEDI